MARSTHDGREDGARRVVARKTGLAHTRSIVKNEHANVLARHGCGRTRLSRSGHAGPELNRLTSALAAPTATGSVRCLAVPTRGIDGGRRPHSRFVFYFFSSFFFFFSFFCTA